MKHLKITLIAATAIMILAIVCSGLVAAQNPEESFVRGILSNPNPNAGDLITVQVFFHNNSTSTITLYFVGVHFDWMPTNNLFGFNLSSLNPQITVAAGQDYFFQQPINVKIPETVNGVHSYFVGIDGYDPSGNLVSLTSDPAEFEVNGTGATLGPTSTNTNPTNQQGGGSIPDIIVYGAIIAVVAVVVILLAVLLMRRRRKPESKPVENASTQPASKQPEQKPSSGQDFSI